jgi:hypothetical protein
MGLYFNAEDWFARTGGSCWEAWDRKSEGIEVRSRGRGDVITVPNGEKDSGLSGMAVMRQLGVGENFGGSILKGNCEGFD